MLQEPQVFNEVVLNMVNFIGLTLKNADSIELRWSLKIFIFYSSLFDCSSAFDLLMLLVYPVRRLLASDGVISAYLSDSLWIEIFSGPWQFPWSQIHPPSRCSSPTDAPSTCTGELLGMRISSSSLGSFLLVRHIIHLFTYVCYISQLLIKILVRRRYLVIVYLIEFNDFKGKEGGDSIPCALLLFIVIINVSVTVNTVIIILFLKPCYVWFLCNTASGFGLFQAEIEAVRRFLWEREANP